MESDTPDHVKLARRVLKHGEYHPHKQPRDSVWYDRLELARAVLAAYYDAAPTGLRIEPIDAALTLARAVLEMAEAWVTCPACGEAWRRKDGTETHDDVCQQRDAAFAEVDYWKRRCVKAEVALENRAGWGRR